jgi:hypothetical protein
LASNANEAKLICFIASPLQSNGEKLNMAIYSEVP